MIRALTITAAPRPERTDQLHNKRGRENAKSYLRSSTKRGWLHLDEWQCILHQKMEMWMAVGKKIIPLNTEHERAFWLDMR